MFTITGVDNMLDNLQAVNVKLENDVGRAVASQADDIITDAKANYVPVDTSDLMRSGKVGRVSRNGKQIGVSLGFGDEQTAPRAVAIHEHLSVHSPPSWQNTDVKFNPPGRGPKYLEIPFRNSIRGMADRLAQDIKLP
jgi:hypothetical protein